MRILYAMDESDVATATLRWLAGLPLDTGCTLTILTVAVGERDPDDAVLRATADEVSDTAVNALGHRTASLERQTRRGYPAAEIIRAAEERPPDLIVLGSHGHSATARFLLGSIAEQVARHTLCPVLLVRGPGDRVQRVVLGIDGSDAAAQAAEWLRQFPLPLGCEVRLVTLMSNLHELARELAIDTPPLTERRIPSDEWQQKHAATRLAETAASFAAAGKPTITEIRTGDPAAGLLEVAAEEGADLIVMGAHGPSAIDRFLLGSVAEHVLRHAHCSVLVVKGAVTSG